MIRLDSKAKNICVYLIPLTAALLARIILFSNWLESPFRYYHKISGLDMKTVLAFAESFCHGGAEFSNYKFFYWTILTAGGGITALIACQYLLGILTALLITFITLGVFRNRTAAVISGTFAALYSPELMYESMTLIESVFVFTSALSLAAIVRQSQKPDSKAWLFIAGFAAVLPSLGRFSGILWTLCAIVFVIWMNLRHARKTTLRIPTAPICIPLIGLVAALLPVTIFNAITVSSLNPIPALPRSGYVLKAGADVNFTSHSTPPNPARSGSSGITRKAGNYAEKFLSLFKAYEIPDNLNYYFVREFLKPLNHLAGPLFLLPFASLGILILLYQRRFKGRTGLLFLYLIAFAIPMTVFIPFGRYRLILLPVFCASAGYAIVFILSNVQHFQKKYVTVLVLTAAYSVLFFFASPSSINLRAEDFVGYGNAMEIAGGYDSKAISDCFRTAYDMNPSSASAVIHYANSLMKNSEFKEAESVLGILLKDNPSNPTVAINYASSLLGTGKPAEAEKLLKGIPEPESRNGKVNYYYQLGESRRMQGRNSEARLCYELALLYSDTDAQKNIVMKVMKGMK
ncbi:MAG TPA: hypothetical protein DCZ94_21885 [Lentisphaeria bacterium]|nr:MAG: hypothetical protein A2X48_19270 [Lentisphaerae bacterium GWF2_49_21]HBC89597.1 hypothetical protein [Lentisphaeria bacterium]